MEFAFDAACEAALWGEGFALVPNVLSPEACDALVAGFADDERYRSTVDMARHGFGSGRYRYFADPLPLEVAALRDVAYARLAPFANRWNDATRMTERYPAQAAAYRDLCAAAGQERPTPLVLRYAAGDYNALHQDLYGERAFPFQLTVFLSERAAYDGGESVLVTNRPRAQSTVRVVTGGRGDALVFPNRYRPLAGRRGALRGSVRHGVSAVTRGERYALGVIFHGAR